MTSQICEALGVNPDGTPAAGGLTAQAHRTAPMIKKYASMMGPIKDLLQGGDVDALKDALGNGRVKASATVPSVRRRRPGLSAASVIEALDLQGPIRAALRSAAQSLASALNDGRMDDGGTDDAGVFADKVINNLPGTPQKAGEAGLFGDTVITCGNGHKTLLPVLGAAPYLLVRFKAVDNGGQVEILAGGAGGADAPDIAELLSMAVDGCIQAQEQQGYVLGKGGMEGLVVEYKHVDASAAGPSTEAPYGVPPQNTPQETAPDSPPAGDDEGSDGPGPSSDAPDRESPAGGAAPVNDR